jgi:hypothetical protein
MTKKAEKHARKWGWFVNAVIQRNIHDVFGQALDSKNKPTRAATIFGSIIQTRSMPALHGKCRNKHLFLAGTDTGEEVLGPYDLADFDQRIRHATGSDSHESGSRRCSRNADTTEFFPSHKRELCLIKSLQAQYNPHQLSTENNPCYTRESMLRRQSLFFNSAVRYELYQIWNLADANSDSLLNREEYMAMHEAMWAALHCSDGCKEDQKESALNDWERDRGDFGHLNLKRFLASWFDLADMHTEGVSETEYCDFLSGMRTRMIAFFLSKQQEERNQTTQAVNIDECVESASDGSLGSESGDGEVMVWAKYDLNGRVIKPSAPSNEEKRDTKISPVKERRKTEQQRKPLVPKRPRAGRRHTWQHVVGEDKGLAVGNNKSGGKEGGGLAPGSFVCWNNSTAGVLKVKGNSQRPNLPSDLVGAGSNASRTVEVLHRPALLLPMSYQLNPQGQVDAHSRTVMVALAALALRGARAVAVGVIQALAAWALSKMPPPGMGARAPMLRRNLEKSARRGSGKMVWRVRSPGQTAGVSVEVVNRTMECCGMLGGVWARWIMASRASGAATML